MNDAGQDWTAGDAPTRVVWFQVGTEPVRQSVPVQPVLVCVRDTMARIGELGLGAVQMVLPVQTARPAAGQLLAGLNCSATADPAASTAVRLTLDSGDDAARWAVPEILTTVRQEWTAPFRVGGRVARRPGTGRRGRPVDGHRPPPRDVRLLGPGVDPDAVGWLGALFVEGCRQAGVRTTVLLGVAR